MNVSQPAQGLGCLLADTEKRLQAWAGLMQWTYPVCGNRPCIQ